jgi:hypothetical protein
MHSVEVPPNAENLINSLRSMGYQLETALADVVDNSIAARSTEIDIKFKWNNSKCEISVLDNGFGMNENELIQALTFASTNISQERDSNDLGRFGLGLKSASLSQARVLEVYSKKEKIISSFSWNLNDIEKANDGLWILSQCEIPLSKQSGMFSHSSGTLVLWKDIDGIFSPGFGESSFLDLIDIVESHLSLIFHRFIQDGLIIRINEKEILAYNPFNDTPTYYISPSENIGINDEPVFVKAYLYMPTDSTELNRDSCYIFRGNRLLYSGGWLGISVSKNIKSSPTKLAIEITNKSDKEWSIDIIKSKANLPIFIKNKISKYLKTINKLLYKPPREQRVLTRVVEDLWIKKNLDSSGFKLNRNSQLIIGFAEAVPETLKIQFVELLNEIESSVPLKVERIFQNELVTNECTNELSSEARKEIRLHLLRLIKGKGVSVAAAQDKVITSGIFSGYESDVKSVAREIKGTN